MTPEQYETEYEQTKAVHAQETNVV